MDRSSTSRRHLVMFGGSKPLGSILCNGEHLAIVESLYVAPARLRDMANIRSLWAGAIGISQADIDEKNI
ncbi:hypothetical protein PVAG01_11464 [Phlyctema vagabunda]|uniref:Uncharacterized protein n=1 Tax=Phlyctema vagabunda TaxID=108571 RepID=A0ABR4P2C7_9HELO